MKKQSVAVVGVEWDVVDLIDSIPHLKIEGFIDPSPSFLGPYVHLGKDADWPQLKMRAPEMLAVLALDDPKLKASLLAHYGKDTLSLLSPHAHISHRASIGHGAIVQRGAVIMPYARLGDGCKVNVNATVHHEAAIGSFCTVAPGAQVLGRVIIEDQVYVGAGAIIRQRCRIGAGALIGAGAVVVCDIPARVTVVGVPAKEMYARAR